jgi:hypothetical protein
MPKYLGEAPADAGVKKRTPRRKAIVTLAMCLMVASMLSLAPTRADASESYVWLKNTDTGFCADLPWVGPGSNGGYVYDYNCRTNDNQQWHFIWDYWENQVPQSPNTVFWIHSAAGGGLCITNEGHGQPVRLRPCNWMDKHQQWYWDRVDHQTGYEMQLRNVGSGLFTSIQPGSQFGDDECLDIQYSNNIHSPVNRLLTMWPCNVIDDHGWSVRHSI